MLRSTSNPDLTADAIAAMFFVKSSTVRRWATKQAHHDPCPHRKDGRGRLRFDPVAVDEWLTTTGVLKRSQAQRPAPAPAPAVEIYAAIRWLPHNVTAPDLTDDDRELVALHRTITTCLAVCRHATDLPTPPPMDLDTEAGRGAACSWLTSLPHRPAEAWKASAREAIGRLGNDRFMGAVYG